MEKIYELTNYIMKVVYINLLTIFFTILGLGIFGFFPALTAAFYIYRKWFTGFSDVPITKNYWSVYKKEFLKTNLIGYLLFFIGIMLYINLSIAEVISVTWIHYTYYLIIIVFIVFCSAGLFVFPVYLHYNGSIWQILKNSLLLLFFQPLQSILMIASIIVAYYIMFVLIPGMIPFFGISLLCLIIMFFCIRTFDRLEIVREANYHGMEDTAH